MQFHARRLIRKMRGGAQAHLLEADDGNFYVVKFKNNPQHRRILINELVASVFLRYLRISAPEAALIQVSDEFLARNPDVYIALGSRRLPVEPGWHFGSRFPGHPERLAVYDFVPDALLSKVVNRNEFMGVLAFDKWVGNADSRQAIFYRASVREPAMAAGSGMRVGFVALMMDHGYVFNGPHWEFVDSPLHGLYYRPAVYENVRSMGDFQPWLERILHFPDEVMDEAFRRIPTDWLDSEEEDALERMFARLRNRRQRVPDLIRDSRNGRVNPFPKWTE